MSRVADNAWMVAHDLLRVTLQAAGDIRLTVQDEGGAAVLDGRPLLIAANHSNVLDGPILCCALPRHLRHGTRFVTSHEIAQRWSQPSLRQRVQRRMFDANYRPIWTGQGTVAAMQSALQAGNRVVILPEGDYWADHTLHPLRSGVAVAAIATGVPILPARIDGSVALGDSLRSHHRLHVRWRPPIAVGPDDTVDTLLSRLEEALHPTV